MLLESDLSQYLLLPFHDITSGIHGLFFVLIRDLVHILNLLLLILSHDFKQLRQEHLICVLQRPQIVLDDVEVLETIITEFFLFVKKLKCLLRRCQLIAASDLDTSQLLLVLFDLHINQLLQLSRIEHVLKLLACRQDGCSYRLLTSLHIWDERYIATSLHRGY